MRKIRILFWILAGLLVFGAFNHKAVVPAYSFDDEWEEDAPDGDLDDISTGDDQMRQDKRAIRERLAVDHNFVADEVTPDSTIGYHQAIHMIDQGGEAPDNSSFYNNGDVLYWKNAAGSASRVTPSSGIMLPSGAVFYMITGSCPTGSTDVTATYSNKFVKINATQGTASGTVLTGTIDSHTLSIAEMPNHYHKGDQAGATPGGSNYLTNFTGQGDSYTQYTNTQGGGQGHTHTMSSATTLEPASITCKMCQVN